MNNNQQAFFALVRAGLWGDLRSVQEYKGLMVQDSVDWEQVLQMAMEQSVAGLAASGVEAVQAWLKDHGYPLIPRVVVVQFAGAAQYIEQQNKDMNAFVAELFGQLREAGINALLVKGQGIAQCYENPMRRTPGDVDLLLDAENYEKGKAFLSSVAQEVHEENDFDKHFSVILDGWDVELHGSMRSMLPKETDDRVDMVQEEAFINGKSRVWNNGGTEVLLPCPDDDVIFVFTHILKHFFHYGIGLRQVCDWCRLVYTYRNEMDLPLLKNRLESMGLMSEWRVFGAMAVNRLGMSAEAMPFYSPKESLVRRADRALDFIMETGNFGHSRDNSRYRKSNVIMQRLGSLWLHTCDSIRHSFIFPVDAARIWSRMFYLGICDALKGK